MDLLQASITTFLTIITGILIYLFSSWYEENVRKPKDEYLKIKSEINILLHYHACRIHNPLVITNETSDNIIGPYRQASNEIRMIASKLYALSLKYPKKMHRKRIGLPEHNIILKVKGSLIGLSNGLTCTNTEQISRYEEINDIKQTNIKENLRLEKDLENTIST